MQIRPKFIRSQRISRLLGPADGRRDVLRPERFRQWPTTQETTPPASGPRQGLDWVQVDNRERFFSDPAICRLCLTVEAGIGKSTAIEQIAYLRQLRERGHLAMTLPFRSLPLDSRQYLHSVQGLPPAIVRRLQSVPGNDSLPDDLAARMVRHKIRIGQFTLLVDGLDHWREPAEAQTCARALADFLRQQPTMRCVIAGRPYAIQRYWTELFEDTGPWEFVQLDLFREDEQRDFLGPERFEKLRRLEGEALATPRSLDTILRLSIDELAELRTLSDVYWCCVSAMLDKARENSSLAILGSLALKLFALLAFEMSCRGNFAGVREQRGELDRFLGEVWLARQTDLAADITNRKDFNAELGVLGALNEMLAPGVWEVSPAQGPELTQIVWCNPTLQAVFAALWLTRYATPRDRERLSRVVFVAGDPARRDWYEIWRLAAEMPAGARSDDVYAETMSILYTPARRLGVTLRSTEMIYRSWPTMLHLAGYLHAEKWSSQDVDDATRIVQQGGPPPFPGVPEARDTAGAALRNFLSEFPEILQGARGPEAQRIATDFEAGFRLVPPEPSDSLDFWTSAEDAGGGRRGALRKGTVRHRFQLSRYPVTNDLYGLFDAFHKQRFPDYERYSAAAGCPAICVCWYDAWSIATWLGGRLPTEQEWEYACRAQPGVQQEATQWWFGDDESELPQRAWYAANSNQRAAAVGCPGHENCWGLGDMHGSVWEWTASWYEDETEFNHSREVGGVTRVLRGGAFSDAAEDARSAARLCDHPAFTFLVSGLRVARAPS